MKRFLSITLLITRCSDCIAGVALILIMLLTSLDVVLRYLGRPIPGTYDLVVLGGAFVIGFAVPKTSWDRTHVSVDILVDKFPERKGVFAVTTRVMALAFFSILGWNLTKLGASFVSTGESTMTIAVPLYPVAYALGICSFVECLVLLADIVRVVYNGGHYE